MTTKKANITIEEYIEMSEVDFNEAVNYEFTSDTCQLANSIYQSLFKFFDKKNFSGDLIFTWKSPSLVKEGDYIGRRDSQVDNLRVIGNIFPNYLTNRKYSLNMNRNGCMGDFPHDFFDIYLDHVAKYAYCRLYTSDAADEVRSGEPGWRRRIKTKNAPNNAYFYPNTSLIIP
ncbi:hypothetical protein PVA38_10845 [Streptococcus pneumoniae D39]|nr:hypothetical protein PVA38_10845 [Streptococcus pneumoniae D39]